MDTGRDAAGRLIEPTCVERSFTSADRLVEFVID